ncbi:MAG: hypothetical protein A2104_07675 [Candidatus Melainabacteria bacterium GWF2_32_7]|nr:MAG: hypothetical protein A2104_07675 [Candidatus Melainabacteria bacterium GWF2_32_7]
MNLKRSIAIVSFCFFLSLNNFAYSAEGIGPPLAKEPSIVTTKQPQGIVQGGAAQQPSIPKPPKEMPKLTEADKKLEGFNETQVKQEILKQDFLPLQMVSKILPFLLLIILALIILVLLIKRLKTKPSTPQKTTQPIKGEKEEPQTITDAVVSFVKHRLRK